MTLAGNTGGVTFVSRGTTVTIEACVFLATQTSSRPFLTLPCRHVQVTITGSTCVCVVLQDSVGSVVTSRTLITVNTVRIVLTVLTDSASLVIPVHIHAECESIHFLVIETLGGMAVTLTGFTHEDFVCPCLLPFLLDKSWTASLALAAACVMFT